MKRAIPDEGMPTRVAKEASNEVLWIDRFPNDWKGTRNGRPIARCVAEGYGALVTEDASMIAQRNIAQRNIVGRPIGIVDLRLGMIGRVYGRGADGADAIMRVPPGRFLVILRDGRRHLTRDVAGSVEPAEALPPVAPFAPG